MKDCRGTSLVVLISTLIALAPVRFVLPTVEMDMDHEEAAVHVQQEFEHAARQAIHCDLNNGCAHCLFSSVCAQCLLSLVPVVPSADSLSLTEFVSDKPAIPPSVRSAAIDHPPQFS